MTPEAYLKSKQCRPLAKKLDLPFWNIEGKSINGIPDTLAGKYPKGSGMVLIEFKKLGEEPTEQQWERINEARACGMEAEHCDSFERFCEIIGYDPDL